MSSNPPNSPSDVWSEWLLHRRHGGDSACDRLVRAATERFAERVLDGARLAPGMTLADVGAGEGLIAFRAIERVGPSLRVLLTDISAPLLRHVQSLAEQRNVRQQCTFLQCGAEKLEGVAGASMDVVTTRAVLAYVQDKQAALREFHRVLKPGGRLSIAEPIFQDDAMEARALKTLLDNSPAQSQDRFLTLLHRWKAAQFPDTQEKIAQSPIVNFTERDLVRFAGNCGFAEIHMELHIDVVPAIVGTWDAFIDSSPHPWAPPLSAILAQQFTAEERQFFEQVVRPMIENRTCLATERVAYLTAIKASG